MNVESRVDRVVVTFWCSCAKYFFELGWWKFSAFSLVVVCSLFCMFMMFMVWCTTRLLMVSRLLGILVICLVMFSIWLSSLVVGKVWLVNLVFIVLILVMVFIWVVEVW